jgi:hypothetical protein
MFATLIGNSTWIVIAAVSAPVAFGVTFYLLAHEPRKRRLSPGHPAYEGDDDLDE